MFAIPKGFLVIPFSTRKPRTATVKTLADRQSRLPARQSVKHRDGVIEIFSFSQLMGLLTKQLSITGIKVNKILSLFTRKHSRKILANREKYGEKATRNVPILAQSVRYTPKYIDERKSFPRNLPKLSSFQFRAKTCIPFWPGITSALLPVSTPRN